MKQCFFFFGLLFSTFFGSGWMYSVSSSRPDQKLKEPAYQKIVNALGLRSKGLSRDQIYPALMRHHELATAPCSTRVFVAGKKYYKVPGGWSKHKHGSVQQ